MGVRIKKIVSAAGVGLKSGGAKSIGERRLWTTGPAIGALAYSHDLEAAATIAAVSASMQSLLCGGHHAWQAARGEDPTGPKEARLGSSRFTSQLFGAADGVRRTFSSAVDGYAGTTLGTTVGFFTQGNLPAALLAVAANVTVNTVGGAVDNAHRFEREREKKSEG